MKCKEYFVEMFKLLDINKRKVKSFDADRMRQILCRFIQLIDSNIIPSSVLIKSKKLFIRIASRSLDNDVKPTMDITSVRDDDHSLR